MANWFLQSTLLGWVMSFAGVLIFAGLTVYDSNKQIDDFLRRVPGAALAVQRVRIIGALKLYLDFLDMSLFTLRIVGGRR